MAKSNNGDSDNSDSNDTLTEQIAGLSAAKRVLLELKLGISRSETGGGQRIPRLARRDSVPLSFAQQRLWFLDRLEPGSNVYSEGWAVRLRGALDVRALQSALDAIVTRHEVLRTTFTVTDGTPVQAVAESRRTELKVVDLAQSSPSVRDTEASRLVDEELRRPFNLSSDLMLRAALLKMQPEEHILLLIMHHIATDVWSTGILFRELSASYEAFATGEPSRLPELPIQYADFAVWQQRYLEGGVLELHLVYWKQKLAGVSVMELPTDRPRPAVQSYRGKRESLTVPEALTKALKELSRHEGVTLFMLLLAAFKVLLHRYTGQDDTVVGSPIAGRSRVETEGLIGFFVNTVVLRTDLSGNPSFREILQRVKDTALEAYAHQDVPFEKLVEELQPARDLGSNPLFQVMFALQNIPAAALRLPGIKAYPVETHNGTAKFDLNLGMVEEANELKGFLEYNTDLFETATVRRIIGHFQTLLEAIAADAHQRLSDLPILTQAERRQVLIEWNDTEKDYAGARTIHGLFEAQAEKIPEACAVIFKGKKLTYRELNHRANQLAHHLRSLGVGPEVLVGVCVERSWEMVVALLGILKAGGAYVPLDPSYPNERLAFMLQDAQAPVLLTQARLTLALSKEDLRTVCLDTDWETIAKEDAKNLTGGATAENLAYVIYTSGSTGKPKGTQITHRAAANFLRSMREQPGMTDRDILLAVTTFAFDIAALEIFLPLSVGARLVIVGREVAADGTRLLEELIDSQATITQATPATWRLLLEAGWQGSERLKLLCGGEALPRELASRLLAASSLLWNLYGPTETTIWSALYRVEHKDGPVSIGRPIANTQIYLLGRYLQPVPVGVPGELYIGGAGLARGYHNRPELTEEKFIGNPFSDDPKSRLYRSGDIARYLPDGNIEFLGRLDDQVKVRGYRIELGEIEVTLALHSSVREAVVVAQEDVPGDPSAPLRTGKRLVAYVVANRDSDPLSDDLRNFLKLQLPDYMVPSAFVILDSLPLTPNGKVDRKALPAPEQSRPELDETFSAPRTAVEELLAGIWAEVLKLEKVGIHNNFFELGGHSLLATQVMSRLLHALSVELPLRALFENPTVAGLAEQFEATRRKENRIQPLPMVPVARDKDLPLSFAQQRLWFLDQLEANSSVYNVPIAQRLQGPLDIGALEQSLNEIVQRHETLRTTFSIVEGQPVQRISPTLSLSLSVIDLSHWPERERQDEARRLTHEEAQRPFDLSQGPLFRTSILRLGEDDQVLLLTMHHIVSDGWSMGVLYGELSMLYRAFVNGEPSPLPKLPIQYADYAAWQRKWLQGEVLESQLSYWKKQLENIPAVLNLPTDRPRPAVQSYHGATQSIELSRELTGALKALSRKEGATLFMTLLAAFQTLLHRYTGQEDIVVGSPIAGRNRSKIEGLIGFFVNTLALRSNFSGNPTFKQLLARVKEVALGAYAHQELPFEKLVEELHPERDLSHSPLFQVMFVLQNTSGTALKLGGVAVSPMRVGGQTAKFDLTLSMHEEAGELRGSVEYSTDLFDDVTISRMLGHLQVLLDGIVADPDQPISALPILTEPESHQLLVEWNDTKKEYPKDKCIHELFEEQAEKSPDAVAVVFEDEQLTYRELNRRANQLAHYLGQLGVGPDVVVGLCTERSLGLVIGLLGVLKAGGAYVPLDPSYPTERLGFMLEDTGAGIVLIDRVSRDSLPPSSARVICLEQDWEEIAKEAQVNPSSKSTADNLAYVIYTSGSTGRPKGVEVRHRGVVRLLFGVDYVQLDRAQTFLHLAPISFDAATFEVWGALLHGGKCVLFPGKVPSPRELGAVLKKHRVNTLWLTAALFNTVINEEPQALSDVKQLLIGGEALSVPQVRKGLALLANTKIINGYGPTESTTFTCCYAIPRQLDDNISSIPIGKPIGNTQVYILDTSRQPVPIGVTGELYISGDGVARGYLNRPELTAERFIQHSFDGASAQRLYRTGDLARCLPDGNIEFLGRADNQVKIRGFRIELGEIETVLGQHPGVHESAVIVRDETLGEKRLVAYVVQSQGPAVTVSELRSFLKHKLPDYMSPSLFVFLECMPLTPNGKVNRKALPVPDQDRPELEAIFVRPRNSVEELLAEIWAEVLRVEKIGIHDDFFDLGGHSLLATQIVSRIRRSLRVEVPLRSMFEAPTIAGLAIAILKKQAETIDEEDVSRILAEMESLSEEEIERQLMNAMK